MKAAFGRRALRFAVVRLAFFAVFRAVFFALFVVDFFAAFFAVLVFALAICSPIPTRRYTQNALA
jgi:hypothetical protein